MKITVVYQSGSIVQCKVLEVKVKKSEVLDNYQLKTVWAEIESAGIHDGDVWFIFKGECVHV